MRAEMDGEAFEPRLVAQSRAPSSSPAAPNLADQLRAQWAGDWNISGIDRAQELSGILQGRGVTSLSGLKIGGGRTYVDPSFDDGQLANGNGMSREDARAGGYRVADTTDGKYLDFGGGLTLGNFSRPERDMFGSGNADPGNTEFGYSTAGKGAVGYHAVAGPNGQVQINPQWASSSEAPFWRGYATTAAQALAAVMGGPALLGTTGAGAGAAAAGAGAFEGIGGAMAAGGAPMTAAEFAAIGAGGVGAGAGIAPMTAAELAVSAAPYANTLTPQLMAAGIPDIAGMTVAGGAGGATSSLFANEGAAQLGQWSAANPVTQASVNSAALGPTGSLLGAPAAITPTSFDALRAAEKANMGQVAGNVPSTVNMGSLGGTTATSGGIQGFTDVAAQQLRDATASSEIGGSALSQAGSQAAGAVKDVGSAASAYQTWVKENPLLARGIAAGLGGLVGGLGGGNSGGGAPTFTGPPKAWGSGLQIGIQPGAYQPRMTTAPGAVRPSSGLRMSGASRYFGG